MTKGYGIPNFLSPTLFQLAKQSRMGHCSVLAKYCNEHAPSRISDRSPLQSCIPLFRRLDQVRHASLATSQEKQKTCKGALCTNSSSKAKI